MSLHVSPSPRQSTCASFALTVGESECVTPDLSLMEVTELQCGHHPHTVQVDKQAQDADQPDERAPDEAGRPVMCLDLSTLTDPDSLVSGLTGDKASVIYEGYVLTLNRSKTEQSDGVCLERRFNSMCSGSPFQEYNQTVVPNKFLPAETQEPLVYLQMHKWVKDPVELSGQHGVDFSNPSTYMCGQVFGHSAPFNEHQSVIHPFTYSLEMDLTNAQFISNSGSAEVYQPVIAKNAVTSPVASTTRCKSRSSRTRTPGPEKGCKRGTAKSQTSTREKHNRTERERRKRIRSSCDKLNKLVPFCHQSMDKASTLQLTTKFLTYINKVYGDALKKEYKNAVRSVAVTSSSSD